MKQQQTSIQNIHQHSELRPENGRASFGFWDSFICERQKRGEAVQIDIFRHTHLILRGIQVAWTHSSTAVSPLHPPLLSPAFRVKNQGVVHGNHYSSSVVFGDFSKHSGNFSTFLMPYEKTDTSTRLCKALFWGWVSTCYSSCAQAKDHKVQARKPCLNTQLLHSLRHLPQLDPPYCLK